MSQQDFGDYPGGLCCQRSVGGRCWEHRNSDARPAPAGDLRTRCELLVQRWSTANTGDIPTFLRCAIALREVLEETRADPDIIGDRLSVVGDGMILRRVVDLLEPLEDGRVDTYPSAFEIDEDALDGWEWAADLRTLREDAERELAGEKTGGAQEEREAGRRHRS